jgi:hypothetical protein
MISDQQRIYVMSDFREPSHEQKAQESFSQTSYRKQKAFEPLIQVNDRLRWKIQRLCHLSALPKKSRLYDRTKEYSRLATLPELSEAEIERLAELYDEAQYDVELSNLIRKIDEDTNKLTQIQENSVFQKDNLLESLTLEQFLCKLRYIPSEEMTLDIFQVLVERLDLSEDLLNSHILFSQRQHQREVIHSSKLINISVISWKPGDHIDKHAHEDSLSIIRVCRGELTHWNWKPVDLNSQQYKNPRGKGEKIHEDGLVCLDYFEEHELSNQTKENLITLHFRYYKQSESRDEAYESSCHLELD